MLSVSVAIKQNKLISLEGKCNFILTDGNSLMIPCAKLAHNHPGFTLSQEFSCSCTMTQILQHSLPLSSASVHVLETRDYSRQSFCSDIVALCEIHFASFFYRSIILSKLRTANFISRA